MNSIFAIVRVGVPACAINVVIQSPLEPTLVKLTTILSKGLPVKPLLRRSMRCGIWLGLLALWAMLPAHSLRAASASLNLTAASDQYVFVTNNASLTPAQLTVEAWINIPAVGVQTIVSRGDGGNGSITDYIFQMSNAGASAGAEVSLFAGGGWDATTNSIPTNTWTHVAATFDGTNKQFYINGLLNWTTNRQVPIYSTPSSPLYIGRQGSVCNCNFFQGQIAEVRIWNTVRSASQIVADMSYSSGAQSNLVAYYHLNEGGGTNAIDSSGNGNTGTLANGATWAATGPPPFPALGATTLLEAPSSASDSVVLSYFGPWTNTANASWLHLGAGYQSGAGSTNVVFSFDANTGVTRTGTLTIAGLTLTVTQAGSTYVAAPQPVITLANSGLNGPNGVAVDAAGNVYIADTYNNLLKEWVAASNTVITLVTSGLNSPQGVAVDGAGNLYIADVNNSAIKEWIAASNTVTTLVTSGLNHPGDVAVDGAGNLYIADTFNNAIKKWVAASNTLTTLVSSGLSQPHGVAVDVAGNVYFTDPGHNAIKKWIAANHTVITLVSLGLNAAQYIAPDGAGNLYIADTSNNAIKKWIAASSTVITLLSSGLNAPQGIAEDASGNVYIADSNHSAIEELPRAFIDPTPRLESPGGFGDALPPVLPLTENLLAPFAPTSDQSWLTITGVTNGAVSYSLVANTGAKRTARITLLGLQIPVVESAPLLTLGTARLWEGPAAGLDSVVLGAIPAVFAWTATANTNWLHLSAAFQSGAGGTNVVFSFDANPGTNNRTGTLTIAGLTLTVTQAGSTYVSATPLTTLVRSGPIYPGALGVDGPGNVYIADDDNNAIERWSVAGNTVTTLVSGGLEYPFGVAADAAGNIYIADTFNGALKEWVAASNVVATLVSGLNGPWGLAMDIAGNVYIAESGNDAIREWSPATQSLTTPVSSGVSQPESLAADGAGNIYIADLVNHAIKEWSGANHTVTTLVSGLGQPNGVAVDGSGNVYIADTNGIIEWSAANQSTSRLLTITSPGAVAVAVDGSGNVYFGDGYDYSVQELPRAFVDLAPRFESPSGGSDVLSPVLPATENLLPPFVPTSDQPWLKISGVTNGAVSFVFTANSGAPRTAHITLLGQTIPVTQNAAPTPPTLTGARLSANGSFQFAFTNTPGVSFTVLSATNVSLPLSSWTSAGAPVENPPGQYLFTGPPATNSQLFYLLRSP